MVEGLIDFSGIPTKRGFEEILEISNPLRGGLNFFSRWSLEDTVDLMSISQCFYLDVPENT